MADFWLNKPTELVNVDNFNFKENKKIKILNVLTLLSLVLGIILVLKTRNKNYFVFSCIVVILIIFYYKNTSTFSSETKSLNFELKIVLLKSVSETNADNPKNNKIFVSNNDGLKEGDVIVLQDSVGNSQTNIISDVIVSPESSLMVLFRYPITFNFQPNMTKFFKVGSANPQILSPPEGNISIGKNDEPREQPSSYLNTMSTTDRHDFNLEQSTYFQDGYPGAQGPPDGPLKCRQPTVDNPMGVLNLDDYGKKPTMFGTCKADNPETIKAMETTVEYNIPQRVNDILFHKGNSQQRFTPMPVDTLPNQQDQFAFFLYQNPTNLVNPKYASIFVNDPEKYKLVAKLAKATGTENGG
jgi:hypothetical protein